MQNEPKGFIRKFSDADLRSDLKDGLKVTQIAEKYGVSRQGVNQRVKRLELTTLAAVSSPQESKRFAGCQLDAMEQLTIALSRVNLLLDAEDEWLRDADDPTRYNIGPRSEEIMVTYFEMPDEEGKSKKAKATLRTLLARVERGGLETSSAECRMADPRTLILQTVGEIRQIVAMCVELAQLLVAARAMETFRATILSEIAKESPAVAERIAQAVRRSVLLYQSVGGPGGISS